MGREPPGVRSTVGAVNPLTRETEAISDLVPRLPGRIALSLEPRNELTKDGEHSVKIPLGLDETGQKLVTDELGVGGWDRLGELLERHPVDAHCVLLARERLIP